MRNVITALAFLSATTTLACSFSLKAGGDPQSPQTSSTAPTQTAAATAPAGTAPQVSSAGGRIGSFGKHTTGVTAQQAGVTPTAPTSTSIPGTAATGSAPATGGIPVMAGANAFGSGTPSSTGGWKGSIFFIPAGTTKMPALGSMQPNGILFAPQLAVAPQAMSGGFPGIDATRNENFAIRFEAPLLVENEADYEIRVLSDDGAIVSMDGMAIVDNDGAHGAKDKSGPVHLLRGTHLVTVDYFQATGNVALQLFVKKSGGTEMPFPNKL